MGNSIYNIWHFNSWILSKIGFPTKFKKKKKKINRYLNFVHNQSQRIFKIKKKKCWVPFWFSTYDWMKVYKEPNILPLFSYLYFVNIKFMLVCIFMYYFSFEF